MRSERRRLRPMPQARRRSFESPRFAGVLAKLPLPSGPQRTSADAMKRKSSDDLKPEYDFDYSKAVRGKYYKRILKEGSNVVVLERDVAKAFPNSSAINDA